MKRLLTTAMAMTSMIAAIAQNTTLTCKIAEAQDGTDIALALIDGSNNKPTYQAAVQDGEAVIKLDLEEPRGFFVMLDGKHTGNIIVLGKGDNATMTGTRKGNSVEDLFVHGSLTYMEYYIKRVDRDALNKKYVAHNKMPVYVEYNKAYAAKDTAKCRQLRDSEEWKEYMETEKWFFDEVERQYKSAHQANKDSWFGPFFMMTNYAYLTKDQLPEWEQFSDEVKQSFYGKACHDLIVPPSEVGKQMPDFTFTNFKNKKKTSLSNVLKKNKYVLIDFWASWCNPCRKEIPNIKANYEKYHKKGFDVVSISADAKEKDWLKALQEEKLPWWNDRDGQQGICSLYNVKYYPTIYLLDSEGKVVAKDIRGEKLAQMLEELFK